MKKILFLCALVITVSSCNFTEPEVSGYSNFKFGKLEGKTLNVSFDATVDNENGYGFKVKKGKLNVSVNDLEIGVIDLDKKIKVKRKSKNVYTIPLQLSQVLNGTQIKMEWNRSYNLGYGLKIIVND